MGEKVAKQRKIDEGGGGGVQRLFDSTIMCRASWKEMVETG